ncbi:MAG: TPM domain-containing protein [Lachnospiraceae bacterium]
MRKSVTAILLFLLLALPFVSVGAAVVDRSEMSANYAQSAAPLLTDNADRVYDYAGVLSETEIQNLESTIAEVEQKKGFDIVIVTTNENTQTPMVYADDFYDYNGFSKDGILFLLDLDNRQQWISTSGSCITQYPTSALDKILDKTTGYARDGSYTKVFETFVKEVHKRGDVLYALVPTALSLGISAVLAAAAFLILLGLHKSAEPSLRIVSSAESSGFAIKHHQASLLSKNTTSRIIPRDTGSSSGGGGTHTGGSGTSHGGSGRGF